MSVRLLAALTDDALRARSDPEAKAELIIRGLADDPGATKRGKELRQWSEDQRRRRFVR